MDVKYTLTSNASFLTLEDTGSYIQNLKLDSSNIDFKNQQTILIEGIVSANSSYSLVEQVVNFSILIF